MEFSKSLGIRGAVKIYDSDGNVYFEDHNTVLVGGFEAIAQILASNFTDSSDTDLLPSILKYGDGKWEPEDITVEHTTTMRSNDVSQVQYFVKAFSTNTELVTEQIPGIEPPEYRTVDWDFKSTQSKFTFKLYPRSIKTITIGELGLYNRAGTLLCYERLANDQKISVVESTALYADWNIFFEAVDNG